MISRNYTFEEIMENKKYEGYFVLCKILARTNGIASVFDVLELFEKKKDVYCRMENLIKERGEDEHKYVVIPVPKDDSDVLSFDVDVDENGEIVRVEQRVTHIEWYKMFRSIYNVV